MEVLEQVEVEMRAVQTVSVVPVNSNQSRPISHSIASATSNQQLAHQYPESVRSFSIASAQSNQSIQSNPASTHSSQPVHVQQVVTAQEQQKQKQDDEIVSVLVELEEEKNKGSKWMNCLWLIWNTFDLITDFVLGFEWFYGIGTSLSQTSQCANSENTILKICGIAMMLAGVVGYLCYLFDTYRLLTGKQRVTKDGCNCFRLSKLVLEDLISMILTCVITLQLFQLTTWTIISLGMSSISFVFIMFKEAVIDPCRNQHKCHACLCIFIWLLIVGFLVFFGFAVSRSYTSATTDYGMRIIMIEDDCKRMDEPKDEFDTYSYITSNEIYCYYQHVNISDTVVCTGDDTLYDNGYPDPLTSNLTSNFTVLQYPSCDTINVQYPSGYRDRLVCYDGISLNTKVDSALIADKANEAKKATIN